MGLSEMLRRAPLCLTLLLLISLAAPAQSRLDCPKPVREPRYRNGLKPGLELGAGLSRPLLYFNAAGRTGSGHRFISRFNPYVSALCVLPLNERLAVYGGVSVMQIWQGLGFRYEDAYGAVSIKSYSGSLVCSLPLGVRFRSGERLFLNAGPYLSYAEHKGQSGQSQAGSSGTLPLGYTYRSPDDRSLNLGLRLAADVALTKRLLVTVSCGADAFRSAPGYGRARLPTRPETFVEGSMEPHLLHAGFGLAYRLFAVQE